MANRYPLDKPATKAKAISYILEGLSDAEVAAALSDKRISVTRQAVHAFRKRHADELAPAVAEVERQITDYAIAQKVNRIAGLQSLADRVHALIDDRGLLERTVTSGKDWESVRERFARELPAELRAIYKAAAEEMGDLPRPTDQSINVNVGVALALQWSDGTPA